MTRACGIGLAGRAAAGAAVRLRARLAATTTGGRIELPVPPLAARLLALRAPRVPAPVIWARQTELRLRPVTIVGPGGAPPPAAAVLTAPALTLAPQPAAASAPAPGTATGAPGPATVPAPPPMRLVRETLRERIERTVERALARGRRDEPAAPPAAAPAAASTPRRRESAPPSAAVFPRLALAAPAAQLAAAIARAPVAAPAEPRERPPWAARPVSDASPHASLAHAREMPRLVDAIVGELDRRERAQRERAGWLA